MDTFTAIDFETAERHNICAVGIVTVVNNVIVDEYFTLLQPPGNKYNYYNIRIHGITPEDTEHALTFNEIYPEIKKRLQNKIVVAHNESFDRNVLIKSMNDFNLDYYELNLNKRWECTYKIYGCKLDICCKKYGIDLNHHEALSDAKACALLYLKRNQKTENTIL